MGRCTSQGQRCGVWFVSVLFASEVAPGEGWGGEVRTPLICSQEAAQPRHYPGAGGVWPWRRGDPSCPGACLLLPRGRAGKDSQTPPGCLFPLFSGSRPFISSTNNNLRLKGNPPETSGPPSHYPLEKAFLGLIQPPSHGCGSIYFLKAKDFTLFSFSFSRALIGLASSERSYSRAAAAE